MAYLEPHFVKQVIALAKDRYHIETIASVLELRCEEVAAILIDRGYRPKYRGEAWKGTRPIRCAAAAEMPDCATPEEQAAGAYVPTPAEIKRQCEIVQAGWTEGERQRRSNGQETCFDPVELAEGVTLALPRKGIRGTHV